MSPPWRRTAIGDPARACAAEILTRTGGEPPALLRSAREAQNIRSRRVAFAGKIHGFDPLAPPRNPRARRPDPSKILLRLAEMHLELARAFDEQSHVVHELADLGLDGVRFVAHARVAENRLSDAER